MTTAKDSNLLARFTSAVKKTFSDAQIDGNIEDLACSYGRDIGFWAHNDEEEGFVVEVNYPFPVVKEEESPDYWHYFKIEYTSVQLESIAKKTLLQSGHGWQELDSEGMGLCPVDWGGVSLTLENDASEQVIEQVVKDLEHYFKEARKEVNKFTLEKTAQAWFVAKCQQMGLKSSCNLPMPLVPLEDKDNILIVIAEGMIAGAKSELLPARFRSEAWSTLTMDKLAVGDRFCFAESKGNYFAFHGYLVSFARRVLLLAVEPMQNISRTYELIHEINQEGQLHIQLKSQSGFNPWFLISPYDLLSAKALEPKEPTISQRAGLLRAVLGESRVPRIDFSSMSDNDFEMFCGNLLIAGGKTEIERRGSSRSRDSGVDISCNYERPESFGKKTIKILVQCKKIKASFGKTEYNKLNFHELLLIHNADEFIVMCSSEPTKDVLELAHASEGKLQILGNTRLRAEVAKYPELLIRKSEKPRLDI